MINTDSDTTIIKLSESIENHPDGSIVYYLRSRAYQHKSEWDDALSDINRAIDLDPNASIFYKLRAEIYLEKSSFTHVIKDYERYLELGRDEIEDRDEIEKEIVELLTNLFLSGGNIGNELQIKRKYRERAKQKLVFTSLNLVINFKWKKKGDRFTAITDYEKYLEMGGDELKGKKNGSSEVTVQNSKPVIRENNRKFAEQHYKKGEYLFKNRDLEGAFSEFETAAKLDPDYASPYLAIFDIFAAKGDWERAIKYVSKAIDLDPQNPTAFNNRAGAYFNTNKFDKAIKDMETAIHLDPNDIGSRINLAACYIKNEGFDKVHDLLSSPTDKEKQDPRIYYYRGIAYYYKDLHQKAIEDFSKYCDLGGYPGLDSLEKIRGIIENLRKIL